MNNSSQPVLIGEVLFDQFENGISVLGGAPFNVAWHLQGFGQSPIFISRIGKDEYGEKIMETMQNWGMSTTGLQLDNSYSTGKVEIALNNGQPSFDICDQVAYDYIDLRQIDDALSDNAVSLLYHGSLAARHEQVYDVILQLRQASEQSFVDINLRPPWWNKEKIIKLMQGASWLKVNDDELISLTGADNKLTSMIDATKDIMQEHDISSIILTLGAEGAFIVQHDQVFQTEPVKVNDIKDTVGAGDAFSSICILGMTEGWDIQSTLIRAAEFAAKICQQEGATQANSGLYDNFRRKWELSE